MKKDDLGAQSATEDVSACPLVPTPELPHDARTRILAKGQGWCKYTHQHDNSRAALAAAREALLIVQERMRSKMSPFQAFILACLVIDGVLDELADGNQRAEQETVTPSVGDTPPA
jgi:hypothetical protein